MHQIVFFVDDVPIRVFKNSKDLGVRYPFNQPMRIYSSLWNADDWATRGGLEKTDWSKAPFVASYRGLRKVFQLALLCTKKQPSDRPTIRMHQPAGGTGTISFGEQMTPEEAEALLKKRPAQYRTRLCKDETSCARRGGEEDEEPDGAGLLYHFFMFLCTYTRGVASFVCIYRLSCAVTSNFIFIGYGFCSESSCTWVTFYHAKKSVTYSLQIYLSKQSSETPHLF